LISLDTTRADHLGCYGYAAAATPTLDTWAREGVVFDRAMTQVPVTLPAHTSLLTGLAQETHGVRDNGLYRLGQEWPTLAETLSDKGWATTAVVGAAVLDRQYGLGRGFEHWDDRVSGVGGMAIAERSATEVTDAALRAAELLGPPYFLFVHYFDAHADYRPPAPFAGIGTPYDGEIAYVDHELGRLRDGLRSRGLLDNTIIAVVADHGEGLDQHGEATHGVFLYQSTLRVPWILWAPGRLPAARRVSQLTALIDVMPTLIDLADLELPGGLDGRSMNGVWSDPESAGPDRWLTIDSEFGFNSYGWAPLGGLTDGRLKWIDAPRRELYDLATDPGELRDLAADRPQESKRLAELWSRLRGADHRALPPGDLESEEQAELLARLASLGYVKASGGGRADSGELPDPKDVIGTLAQINRAREQLSAGRTSDAVPLLQSIIEGSPRNVSALVLLGSAYISGGQPERAVEPLTRAAELAPHNGDVHFNRGLALMGAGNVPAAEAAWRDALRVSPRYLEAAANLIDSLLRSSRLDDAERAIADARAGGNDDPVFDYLEGRLALLRGDRAGAKELLKRAVAGQLPPQIAADARRLFSAL
jgi:arylsulfatase A-like enzyme/Flp pilus assembly protein TadD